jgi:hypothetical protein
LLLCGGDAVQQRNDGESQHEMFEEKRQSRLVDCNGCAEWVGLSGEVRSVNETFASKGWEHLVGISRSWRVSWLIRRHWFRPRN